MICEGAFSVAYFLAEKFSEGGVLGILVMFYLASFD
jgi:hypothetical protein